MKLHRVKTIVKEYCGCKDVRFVWFYCDVGNGQPRRRRPRLYTKLIEKYDPCDEYVAYSKCAIDELFTAIEANALKEYLDRRHGGEGMTTIEEVDLPVPSDTMGVGAMPVGGGHDFYMLDKEPEYALPFRVLGYFNLVGCELVDGPGVYHHRLLLLSPDGTLRRQTNDEAGSANR